MATVGWIILNAGFRYHTWIVLIIFDHISGVMVFNSNHLNTYLPSLEGCFISWGCIGPYVLNHLNTYLPSLEGSVLYHEAALALIMRRTLMCFRFEFCGIWREQHFFILRSFNHVGLTFALYWAFTRIINVCLSWSPWSLGWHETDSHVEFEESSWDVLFLF